MDKVLKKLGYREQTRVLIMNAPQELLGEIRPLLKETPHEEIKGQYEFILFFARALAEVHSARESLAEVIEPEGRLWICYPKKSSKKLKSDLSRDILWDAFGAFGFEPVSNYAIDEDWSSVRFRPVDEIKSLKRRNAATEKGRQRSKE